MHLIYRIQVRDNPMQIGTQFNQAIELPRGCGIDHATKEIDRMIHDLRELSLEIHAAHTEGREVDLRFLGNLKQNQP